MDPDQNHYVNAKTGYGHAVDLIPFAVDRKKPIRQGQVRGGHQAGRFDPLEHELELQRQVARTGRDQQPAFKLVKRTGPASLRLPASAPWSV